MIDSMYKDSNEVNEFRTYIVSNIIRSELGIKSFSELESIFIEIKFMIDEMISLSESNIHMPSGLKSELLKIISEFNRQAKALLNYNMDQDAERSFQIRTRLIESIRGWYNSLYSTAYSQPNGTVTPSSFLQVYNYIKTQSLASLQKDKSEIDNLKAELEKSTKNVNELLNLLQSKASGETVQDYAKIFENEAQKHSSFRLFTDWKNIKIGSAQIWLCFSIVFIISFIIIIKYLNSIYPIHFEISKGVPNSVGAITLELFTRILIISFAIYIITFTFKQYNVHNHLYTVNKHRQNTLNSFKLFISSLDPTDIVTRNALMMEVAKAIYESGQSGYISNKDSGDSNPSIIEMTRFVGKS